MPKEQDDAAIARQLAERDVEESGIECGCCFSEYPFVSMIHHISIELSIYRFYISQDKMIQCPEAHLFCIDCMSTYAETLLGSHDANIVCMDQSGCKLPFPESELHRFLSEKLLALYDRVKQRKEIEAAGLENLEECPFCDYKVVIDNEAEKLFRCEKEDCGAVTCRGCKKPVRYLVTCIFLRLLRFLCYRIISQRAVRVRRIRIGARILFYLRCFSEVEDDKKLDGRHAVEEAMSEWSTLHQIESANADPSS